MKKQIKKLLGILFLTSAILATQIPAQDVSADTSASTADASGFVLDGSTLLQYTGTDSSVSVPDSVSKITENAFSGVTTLQKVTIPASVTEIGSAAFSNCTGLKNVTVSGAGLTKMGDGVFSGCKQLATVDFDAGAGYVCTDGVIYNAKKTKLIEVLEGSKKETLTIPATVTEIASFACWGCDTLKSVTIPDSVKIIPAYTFAACTNLASVSLPASLTEIDMKAFQDCVNLSDISVPQLAKVDDTAFEGCSKLDSSDIQTSEYQDTNSNTTVVDNGSVSGNNTAGGAANATASQDVSASNPSAESTTAADDSQYLYVIKASGDSLATSKIVGQRAVLFIDNTKQTVYGGETKTAQQESLPSIDQTMNSEATQSGTQTSGTPNAQTSGTPNAQTSGTPNTQTSGTPNTQTTGTQTTGAQNTQSGTQNIQRGQTGANSPVNGTSGAAAPESAKAETQAQNSYAAGPQGATDANGNHIILMQTLSNALTGTDEKGINIPKYTVYNQKIVHQAYYNDSALTSYAFPDGITEIGEFAFARSGLDEVRIPEGVTKIDYAAFYHCSDLLIVSIPDSVTEIAPYAFDHTEWVSDWMNNGTSDFLIVGDGILLAYRGSSSHVVIPEGVKHIAAYAFQNHKGITQVYCPDSLLTIEEGAFDGCSSLSKVAFDDQLTKIGDRAFQSCQIQDLILPASLTAIGLGAFQNDTGKEDTAVVLQGDALPKVSCEESSMRLSQSDYRIPALDSYSYALISNQAAQSLKQTVFDADQLGFTGIVFTPDSNREGSVIPVLQISDENSETISLPETITAGGRIYQVEKPGTLTEKKRQGLYEKTGEVAVSNQAESLGDKNAVTASIADDSGKYFLYVQESEDAMKTLNAGYLSAYGMTLPENSIALDLSLSDATGSVPITRLGKQKISISCNLPSGMKPNGNLHVITADEDGQLEELEYTVHMEDKKNILTFEMSHFSPVGIYEYESSASGTVQVKDGVITLSGKLDESPDTGDLIHPKWFLAAGLLFAALAFFFMPTKRKRAV